MWDSEGCRFEMESLTDYLMDKTLHHYREEFFSVDGKPFWTVFLEVSLIKDKDARTASRNAEMPLETLTEREKALFRALRDWRNKEARDRGIPAYGVATNRQLGIIVEKKCKTLQGLSEIPSFGPKRVGLYGKAILHIVETVYPVFPLTPNELVFEKS